MAGNDPHVHGAGDVRGPAEVGHEAPTIDTRIHDQGVAAGRAGRIQSSNIPTADGLHLSDLDDDGPSMTLAALVESGDDPLDEKRRAIMTRLRELDVRIDETERHLHEAIYEGRTREVEAQAVSLAALFRERVEGAEELERAGAEPPLDTPQEGWLDEADERPSPAPAEVLEDRLVVFIEEELAQAQSPLAARGLGSRLVATCAPHALDPLLLLAVAAHESAYGQHGERWFGVGRPSDSVERQVEAAAAAFAALGVGATPKSRLDEAQRRGWSQEPGWAEQVEVHHARLSQAWALAR